MSGICGIVNLNGAPVDPELLKKMAEAAAYRGPDGIHYWIQGNVGLAHLALHTTPESLRERQPLVNRRGDLVLTADARVDNRDELIPFLTAKGHLQEKDPTDADLILAAYECWAERCPEHIIGDFAFAIWDAGRRHLFAARDRIGCRAFYYRCKSGSLQWATEATQLLIDPTFPAQLNEQMIAHDLALPGYGGRHESYYLEVVKLGPADRLIACEGKLDRERYWDYDLGHSIRYASDHEYAEHFGSLFREAVRARMRAVQPVGLFMSGGLDSTSIAAAAARELTVSSDGLAPGIQAYHWTVGSSPEFDESERSRVIARHWGFEYRELLVDSLWPLHDYPQWVPHRDEPFTSHLYSFFEGVLKTEPDALRPRVWMTGHPGDVVVGGSYPADYLALLQKAKLRSLAGELREHRRLYGISTKQMVVDFFISPVLLRPARRRLRALVRGNTGGFPSWISPSLAERTGLAGWISRQPRRDTRIPLRATTRRTPPAQAWRYWSLSNRLDTRFRVWFDRMAAQYSAEVWAPWDDIRLTQFVLAIPAQQIVRGINHKLILRQAMRDLLPTGVREQRGRRAGTPQSIETGLRTEEASGIMGKLTTDSRAAANDFLDAGDLRQALSEFESKRRHWSLVLWAALSLEMWLRAYFDI